MRRLMLSAALLAVFGGLQSSAYVRLPVARFTGRSVTAAAPARLEFRRVDIVVSDWSTAPYHRELARALVNTGSRAFFNTLCGFPSRGFVSVAGGRTSTLRYAWQVPDVNGGRRVYVATDEPMSLANISLVRTGDVEPLVFLELHLDRGGHGLGKLSDADQLEVTEFGDVIGLRNFESRPTDLVMVEETH